MLYRCPLCLQKLDRSNHIVRFCTYHSTNETIYFSKDNIEREDFLESLFCPEPDCEGNASVSTPRGIFLSHLGCKAKNPFWDETDKRIKIPGREDDGDFLDQNVNIRGYILPKRIIHWQIGMLRRIKYQPEHEFMWFPPMLLAATAQQHNGRKTSGAVVALIGDKSVGKTILAIQATDEQGYIPINDKDRDLTLGHYVFSRPAEGVDINVPLFETLILCYRLHRVSNPELFKLAPTSRGPGDLKAVFIKPSPSAMTNDRKEGSNNPSGSVRDDQYQATGRPDRWYKKWPKAIWASRPVVIVRDALGTFINEFFGKIAPPPPKLPMKIDRPLWYTLILSDLAGEGIEFNDPVVSEVLDLADKIAILVNAVEVFTDSKSQESIHVAHDRFKALQLMNNKKKCCLIVTQMDLVLAKLKKDRALVERIAKDYDHDHTEETRTLLRKWLNKHKSPARRFLATDLNRFDRIFFVWTENLPEVHLGDVVRQEAVTAGSGSTVMQVEQPSERKDITEGNPTAGQAPVRNPKKPESFGIVRFVCWALDIEWSDINQA